MIRHAVAVLALILSGAVGAQTQVPNDFVAGTPARAAEVNENFDELETAVDSNMAGVSANAMDIANSENDIQALNASVANLASGGTGLSVLFYNPNPNSFTCEFVHIPSDRRAFWNSNPTALRINFNSLAGFNSYWTLTNIATLEDSKVALLDLMIRIGNLPLVVEDFRDQASGEFDCSNEKLLSLL